MLQWHVVFVEHVTILVEVSHLVGDLTPDLHSTSQFVVHLIFLELLVAHPCEYDRVDSPMFDQERKEEVVLVSNPINHLFFVVSFVFFVTIWIYLHGWWYCYYCCRR